VANLYAVVCRRIAFPVEHPVLVVRRNGRSHSLFECGTDHLRRIHVLRVLSDSLGYTSTPFWDVVPCCLHVFLPSGPTPDLSLPSLASSLASYTAVASPPFVSTVLSSTSICNRCFVSLLACSRRTVSQLRHLLFAFPESVEGEGHCTQRHAAQHAQQDHPLVRHHAHHRRLWLRESMRRRVLSACRTRQNGWWKWTLLDDTWQGTLKGRGWIYCVHGKCWESSMRGTDGRTHTSWRCKLERRSADSHSSNWARPLAKACANTKRRRSERRA